MILQWLAAEGNERLTIGQKLFAEQLFEVWSDFREVEKEFPKENPTIIWKDALLGEWVFRVSQRSPLVRALKSFRNCVVKLIDDIDKWTISLVLRSQNKDGSPFRQHPLTIKTEQHARLAMKAVVLECRALEASCEDNQLINYSPN